MELIKKSILLENYRVREIDESFLVDNNHGGLSADTSNYIFYKHNFSTTYDNGEYINTINSITQNTTGDGKLYGKILDIKTDKKGQPLRNSNNELIVNTIDIDVFLTQKMDDMGMFTDTDFIPYDSSSTLSTADYLGQEYRQNPLQLPDQFNPYIDGRHPSAFEIDYELENGYPPVTGETDSLKLSRVASYVFVSNLPVYKDINQAEDIYTTYDGAINQTQNYVEYVIGGSVDSNGNYISGTGVIFKTYLNRWKKSIKGKEDKGTYSFKETDAKHYNGGRKLIPNQTRDFNTTLSAILKQEELSGIVLQPIVEDNVFIIRGGEDIFERNSALAEIKTRSDFDDYRDNYF